MVWSLILGRKEEQEGARGGKGNWGSKLFSNNGHLRRPTFENLPPFFSCGVLGEFQLCWNVAAVCSLVVSAEQKWREKTDTQMRNKRTRIDPEALRTCQGVSG